MSAVDKIIQMGSNVAIVVQPAPRNKSHRSTWVHLWNQMPRIPFRFQKICSCQLVHGTVGRHATQYIGASYPLKLGACTAASPWSSTSDVKHRSLVTALVSLSLDLSEQIFHSHCKSQDHPVNALAGAQRVLDSTGVGPGRAKGPSDLRAERDLTCLDSTSPDSLTYSTSNDFATHHELGSCILMF